jgi:hypothetical protein
MGKVAVGQKATSGRTGGLGGRWLGRQRQRGAARLQRGKDENAEGDEKEFQTSALDAKVTTLDSSPIRSSWLYTTALHCWA